MATKETMQKDEEGFKAGFDEETPVPTELSEDEAFGLNMDEVADSDSGEGDAAAVAVDLDKAAAEAGEAAPVEGEEQPAMEGEAVEGQEPEADDEMPEMTQSERTWAGRLRKQEEELRQREAEFAEKAAGNSDAGSAMDKSSGGDDGLVGVDEVRARLVEDFGDEFVDAIVAIAKASANAVATERVSEVSKTVEDVISDIRNSRARRHFEAIYDAHPDFVEASESQEFRDWLGSLTADDNANTMRVIESGSAKEIVDVLTRFKKWSASKNTADGEGGELPASDLEVDDAIGVRSSGLRLPETPAAGADDYKSAWEQA